MADRRRWTHVETKKLVELIVKDFYFLFDAVNPAKRDKWLITNGYLKEKQILQFKLVPVEVAAVS